MSGKKMTSSEGRKVVQQFFKSFESIKECEVTCPSYKTFYRELYGADNVRKSEKMCIYEKKYKVFK